MLAYYSYFKVFDLEWVYVSTLYQFLAVLNEYLIKVAKIYFYDLYTHQVCHLC